MIRITPQSRTIPDCVVEEFITASRERTAEAEREVARRTCILLASMCTALEHDMDALYQIGDAR